MRVTRCEGRVDTGLVERLNHLAMLLLRNRPIEDQAIP